MIGCLQAARRHFARPGHAGEQLDMAAPRAAQSNREARLRCVHASLHVTTVLHLILQQFLSFSSYIKKRTTTRIKNNHPYDNNNNKQNHNNSKQLKNKTKTEQSISSLFLCYLVWVDFAPFTATNNNITTTKPST